MTGREPKLQVIFWGHVHTFINEAEKECSRLFLAGDLAKFEKAWLHSENGKAAKLEIYPWFADATPSAKRSGNKAIHDYIDNMVDYYKKISRILGNRAE